MSINKIGFFENASAKSLGLALGIRKTLVRFHYEGNRCRSNKLFVPFSISLGKNRSRPGRLSVLGAMIHGGEFLKSNMCGYFFLVLHTFGNR